MGFFHGIALFVLIGACRANFIEDVLDGAELDLRKYGLEGHKLYENEGEVCYTNERMKSRVCASSNSSEMVISWDLKLPNSMSNQAYSDIVAKPPKDYDFGFCYPKEGGTFQICPSVEIGFKSYFSAGKAYLCGGVKLKVFGSSFDKDMCVAVKDYWHIGFRTKEGLDSFFDSDTDVPTTTTPVPSTTTKRRGRITWNHHNKISS